MRRAGPHRDRYGFAFDAGVDRGTSQPGERQEARIRGSGWWWAAAATVLALALRVAGHATQSFWTDEVESVKLLFHPQADPVYILTHNFHGPLHKLLVFGWAHLVGSSDSALRLLSVTIGTATVPILYGVSRRWIGESAARWAAFLLAVNPFHIWYSQEVRGYVLLMLIGVVGMSAFLAEVRERSRWSALLVLVSSVAATLSSLGGFFLCVAQGILALIAAWRRGYPVRRFLVIQLLTVGIISPYLLEYGKVVDPESIVGLGEVTEEKRLRGSHTFSILAPGHSIYAYSVGLTLGPSINEMHRSLSVETFRRHLPVMALAGVVFGVVAVAGVAAARRRPELAGFLLVWLLAPIAFTWLLSWFNVKVYNIRYPAAGLAAWPCLLALGLDRMRSPLVKWTAALAIVALSALSLWNLHVETRYWRPGAREAAALVASEGRPGDRILLYTTVEPFRYYYAWRGGGELPITQLSVWQLRKAERLEAFYRDVTSCDGRLWLVRPRSWYIDPQEKVKARLDQGLEHLAHWDLPELPVDLYRCVTAVQAGEKNSSVR